MVVRVASGLTSRCRTLAQAYYIIKNIKNGQEKLTVVWPVDRDLNAGFYDVFSKDIFSDIELDVIETTLKFRTKSEFREKNPENAGYYIKKHRYITALKVFLYKIFSKINGRRINDHNKKQTALWNSIKESFEKKDLFFSTYPSATVGWGGEVFLEFTKNIYQTVYDNAVQPDEICVSAYNGFLPKELAQTIDISTVVFRKNLVDEADKYVKKGDNVLGIHIRRTDHKACITDSKTESYIAAIKEYVSQNPEAGLFLATDDPEEEKNLRNVFGEKLVTVPSKVFGRDSVQGMHAAVVDIICLSRCTCIFGSNRSVFSAFSARYGGIELKNISSAE